MALDDERCYAEYGVFIVMLAVVAPVRQPFFLGELFFLQKTNFF
jgi:hypothetical protein